MDLLRNNGNKRLPNKDRIKQIFLDGVGESAGSPRRNRGRGIEWKVAIIHGFLSHPPTALCEPLLICY